MSLPDQLLTAPVKDLPMIANAVFGFVGVVLGLAVGAFATIYSQNRQSKREKYQELRANLLAVALEVSKMHVWAEKHTMLYMHGSAQQIADSTPEIDAHPAQKIRAIASLYFPDIAEEACALAAAASRHGSAASKFVEMRDSQSSLEKHVQEVTKTFADIVKARDELAKATRKLMDDFLHEKSSKK